MLKYFMKKFNLKIEEKFQIKNHEKLGVFFFHMTDTYDIDLQGNYATQEDKLKALGLLTLDSTKVIKNLLPWNVANEPSRGGIYYVPSFLYPCDYDTVVDSELCVEANDNYYDEGFMCRTAEEAQKLKKRLVTEAKKYQGFPENYRRGVVYI